jgi:hypothetical protein
MRDLKSGSKKKPTVKKQKSGKKEKTIGNVLTLSKSTQMLKSGVCQTVGGKLDFS